MKLGFMRPEHMTRMIRIFGGYCRRLTPARSAAEYAHQLQANAMIFGLNSSAMDLLPAWNQIFQQSPGTEVTVSDDMASVIGRGRLGEPHTGRNRPDQKFNSSVNALLFRVTAY
jgi:hypothetical protein